MIEETSLRSFLDELASRSSTPGGGSAVAIMGAMGAALVAMVCHLTLGKQGYEAAGPVMASTLRRSEELRARLQALVAADIHAFDTVMAAYGLPRQTEAEKQLRAARIQEALKGAAEAPLDCAAACVELIELSRIVAEQGNRNVISDAGVAVLAAHAALRSAALNVQVNVKAIRDEDFVARTTARLDALLAHADADSAAVYEQVWARL